jgi:hypothetical protein
MERGGGGVRSPNVAASVTANGITWTVNNAVAQVTTGSGPARSGSWGFFTSPHGDPTGSDPLKPLRDGFMGSASSRLYGVGAWRICSFRRKYSSRTCLPSRMK